MLDRRIGIRAVTLCFDANGGLRRRRWPQTGYGYARTGVSASLAQIEASLSFHRKICLLKTDLSDGDRLLSREQLAEEEATLRKVAGS